MSLEENKNLAKKYIEELQNAKNIEIIYEILSENCIIHIGEKYFDREKYKSQVESNYKMFPDMHTDITDQIAEGGRVSTQWKSRFTHSQKIMNYEPTLEEVQIAGSSIYRIVGSKIVEIWIYTDRLDMMKQLGALG
ncbi:MAG: ester cyclase [Thermodesulfobacteriota bacterium]